MYRIIIVDDEEITRKALGAFLSEYFSNLELCGSFIDGEDALSYLSSHRVDIVLTDIRMPNMDGLELTKNIVQLYPDSIIFIISGYSEFEYARTALKYGVSNYLLKPIDFDDLSLSLTNAILQLDRRRAELRELNFQAEDTELFFMDLLMGSLTNKSLLRERFQNLQLPFTTSSHPGCFLQITLSKTREEQTWAYGRETLGTALTNVIRLVIPDFHIYEILKKGQYYYFILLPCDPKTAVTGYIRDKSAELTAQIREIMHFDSKLLLLYSFSCLEEYATSHKQELTLPEILLKTGNPDKSIQEDVVIQKAIEYINTHYDMDLTREEVADSVFLSSAYFSRFFKQKTGLSFFDYLTTVRMQKSIELLGTKMRISDIAEKVGYQSRNRFFINFRQYTSYNPTEYRKKILKLGDAHDEGEDGTDSR